MVVGEIPEASDVLVVGGGPGGYAAALRLAQLGRQVTLVERDAIGGTCLNVGCIPSKALIEAANLAHLPQRSYQWGVRLEASIDWPAVQAHLRRTVEALTSGVRQLLGAAGVTVVAGTATLTAPDRVAVHDGGTVRHFTFGDLLLATGSRPVALADLAVDGDRVLDATGALFLDTLPASLVIIGGGYIGVELGTAFAKLGVSVTIVELTDALLPGLDPDLARVVGRRLRELGVTVRLGTRAVGFDELGLLLAPAADLGSPGPGRADAPAEGPGAPADGGSEPRGREVVSAERVVVAVGRRPNSDGLGLQHLRGASRPRADGLLGVGPDRRLAPRVCAIGDLTPGPALAHKAMAEAEVAALTIVGRPAAFAPAAVPAVVFSDPEVATVGLTAAAARDAGADGVRSFRFPLGAAARAHLVGDVTGHVTLVADGAGTVLGVQMVGPHVSELAAEAALAVEMAATLDDLIGVIHPHPTLSEAVQEAALGAAGRPRHVHRSSPAKR